MIFIPGVISNDGHVEALSSGAAQAFVNGQGYRTNLPLVDTGAVASSDSFLGGFRYTSAGYLRVYDATAGVPANSARMVGISVTPDGQACYVASASAGVGEALGGLIIDADGRFYMNVT